MKKIILILLVIAKFSSCFSQDKLMALDKDLSTVTYPFEVKFHPLKSQGQDLKMAYLDVLPINPNGKVIVLLHGKNFNAANWEQTIKELNKKGYRVIAPDQIGFGKSTKPANYQYSFQQLAFNTKSILDRLKINKIMLLGHSMGGMLATRFALSYPEMTDKLILENPIGLEDYKVLTSYQTIDANYQSELKNTVESYRNYQLKYYYDNTWKSQYDPWLNLLAGWTLHKDYPVIAWNAALTTDMIFTQPVVYEFKNIKCPTLLIIGTRDRTAIGRERASKDLQSKMGLYNELGKKTQQAIPNSTLVELDNIGHLPHIESFDRFIKPLTAFLEK
ncbi:alpha/beta hydrolase [Chryseobacterium gotjawalense]|uniref:Alpha/beta hydrolase n=1 Tax=Chryseobacterium gotjawalense TaxID=3042315 RepID=A0ABY8REN4_9FLAO|nr:alpha/beta hydrolase [Chryseobacterium sp. wdc7]WHF52421.1 alpha/beta hydrolase [Chryseobacterium sp. wdc7]